MGHRDKARLPWRAGNVSQHLLLRLRPLAAEILIVRRRPQATWLGSRAARIVCDQPPSRGPVSGMQAGLKHAKRHWCLFIPVDSLRPPQNLLRQLARGSRAGGYAKHAGDHYYLHSLIPRQRRLQLDEFAAQGGRSAANACRVMQLKPVAIRPDPFACWSINTPAQWQRQHRIAR